MPQNSNYKDFVSEAQTYAYKERLNSWIVARLFPDMQRVTVARFRNRSDADGHLQSLRKLIPDANFVVVFDCPRQKAVI
ncbi:hypothetical protein BCD64_04265 [Nostoc sp. MBR 210]|uniref:CpcD n=1 Tax=Nostoc spongiaeforme FACHB-130 TaxID=1357510 RepID=A0ABR8FR44_9NOSO|nr:hypothetical protein [Nostoc spongiaeforme]MBD2593872.1 hypothetical protein [Nostoc spongiaeforme FACHB-130]OCQ89078.1 hypothetical protein BCD64_04265 [Nostoc sp. MBR 210]